MGKIKVEPLVQLERYIEWERAARNHMIREGFWDFGTKKQTSTGEKGAQAKSDLVLLVGAAFGKLVDESPDAAVAWDKLHNEFVMQMSARQLEYNARLTALSIGRDEDITAYFLRAEQYRDILAATGFIIPECVMIANVLKGLPPEYAVVKTTITAGGEFTKATLTTIRPVLVAEEVNIRSNMRDTTPALPMGQRQGRGRGERLRQQHRPQQPQWRQQQQQQYGAAGGDANTEACWKCGEVGHLKRNCPLNKGQQQQRQQGQGRGGQ